jgi:hypothetical protein
MKTTLVGPPRVEAGKNTSTVIPVSRKRRRKGNPVVSDETVMYGYEFSATLTSDRLHYKLQTRPLLREGAPRRIAKQLSGKRKEKVKSGHGPQRDAQHQDILTDRPSVGKITSTSTSGALFLNIAMTSQVKSSYTCITTDGQSASLT